MSYLERETVPRFEDQHRFHQERLTVYTEFLKSGSQAVINWSNGASAGTLVRDFGFSFEKLQLLGIGPVIEKSQLMLNEFAILEETFNKRNGLDFSTTTAYHEARTGFIEAVRVELKASDK